jgi:hypothetical protein
VEAKKSTLNGIQDKLKVVQKELATLTSQPTNEQYRNQIESLRKENEAVEATVVAY